MKKYRIVTDAYAGYEVQVKESWFLPWVQVDFINTFESQQEAIYFITKQKDRDAKLPHQDGLFMRNKKGPVMGPCFIVP